jgi:hypothetical protein
MLHLTGLAAVGDTQTALAFGACRLAALSAGGGVEGGGGSSGGRFAAAGAHGLALGCCCVWGGWDGQFQFIWIVQTGRTAGRRNKIKEEKRMRRRSTRY